MIIIKALRKKTIRDTFNLLDEYNGNIKELVKAKLIELFKIEMDSMHIKYEYNDKFNENQINLKFGEDESTLKNIFINDNSSDFIMLANKDKNVRYNAIKNILNDLYKKIQFYRKYKLIKNKYYFSKNILFLTFNYILYKDFNKNKNRFIQDEIKTYLMKNNINILDYPILTLEYDVNNNRSKNICEIYNDYLIRKEKINLNKYLNEESKNKVINNFKYVYFEIINYEIRFISTRDKENLIDGFDKRELYNFIKELKEMNDKTKKDNNKINELLLQINENIDSEGSNIYKILYGNNNE